MKMKIIMENWRKLINEENRPTLKDTYELSSGHSSLDYIAGVYKKGNFTGFDDPKLVEANEWMEQFAKDIPRNFGVPSQEGGAPIRITQARHLGGGRLLIQWGDGYEVRPQIKDPKDMNFIKSLVSIH